MTPSELPPSFRVVPVSKSEQAINTLGNLFQTKPGVREVSYASATIRAVQELSQRLDGRHHRGGRWCCWGRPSC